MIIQTFASQFQKNNLFENYRWDQGLMIDTYLIIKLNLLHIKYFEHKRVFRNRPKNNLNKFL